MIGPINRGIIYMSTASNCTHVYNSTLVQDRFLQSEIRRAPSYNGRGRAPPGWDLAKRCPQEGNPIVQFASLFNQLLQHFPRTEFAALVKKHAAEHAAKGFTDRKSTRLNSSHL